MSPPTPRPSLLLLVFFVSLCPLSLSQLAPPRAYLINCGSTIRSVIDGRQWLPDEGFVNSGSSKNVTAPVLDRTLFTVRSFPLEGNLHRKFCYVVKVYRGWNYLIRTTYFYGGVNGENSPPVFDQIVDGTLWSVVNTTSDYADGYASYYEGVFKATGKSMSVCIGSNNYTTSNPFISAIEFVLLEPSVYNSTDFDKYGLRLVARHAFGYGGPIIRHPQDQFDRFWEPYGVNTTRPSNRSLSVSGFWNLPASRIFNTALKAVRPEPLELSWPPLPLENSTYYIALYFAHDSESVAGDSRVLDVTLNGVTYFRNLNVTPAGAVVFASRWPLEGLTKLSLTPTAGSNLGPLINGGEMFELLRLGGRTLTRDVIALLAVKDSLQNPPFDWEGDPCFPREYSWNGVTCSDGPRFRVTSLNLTSMGLSGILPPEIAKLTALSNVWLGNNNLQGQIPDLRSLRLLERLHLENNRFSGEIPPSLGEMRSLRELFLQNNNLTGQIPASLIGKAGLDFRVAGNPIQMPPSS